MSDLVGREGGARNLDHRADLVGDLDAGRVHDLAGDAAHDGRLVRQFLPEAHQRDHDFGIDLDAGALRLYRGFEDGAALHLRDFGIEDAQPAAATAEHRVDFRQVVHPLLDLGGRDAQLARKGAAHVGLGR